MSSTEFDPAAIVAHLRETEAEADGAAYLSSLDHDGLLAVAAAAGLTRVERVSTKTLKEKIINQTISARKKFRGLRSW
ncbi:hypothetical protein AB0F91_39830 [Amycolatopsis sp. NPDC023774]|uniref:hypothetical protein n=1 Tax=Amycolatopsis sp. NPDC023774 TaxID=3155015 RepID=UPI0033CFB7AD